MRTSKQHIILVTVVRNL